MILGLTIQGFSNVWVLSGVYVLKEVDFYSGGGGFGSSVFRLNHRKLRYCHGTCHTFNLKRARIQERVRIQVG